jgi:hypothetical protein
VIFRTLTLAAAVASLTLVSAGAAVATDSQNQSDKNHKVGICHATGSEKNPYVFINVDKHAVKAHSKHQDGRDKIGVKSAADCPKVAGASTKATPTPTPVPGKGGNVTEPAATVIPQVGGEALSLLGAAASFGTLAGLYVRRRFNA